MSPWPSWSLASSIYTHSFHVRDGKEYSNICPHIKLLLIGSQESEMKLHMALGFKSFKLSKN